MLDPRSLLSACEVMADVDAGRPPGDASRWADRADQVAYPGLEATAAARPARTPCAAPIRRPPPRTAVEAAEALTDAGLRIDAGRARLCAGHRLRRRRRPTRARAELRTAVQTFEDCGARSLLRPTYANNAASASASPARPGAPRGRAGLSRRELEVVMLVGEGSTNQQIAESLFVSIRTVETHLSHIFAKLGVTSRVGVLGARRRNGRAATPCVEPRTATAGVRSQGLPR